MERMPIDGYSYRPDRGIFRRTDRNSDSGVETTWEKEMGGEGKRIERRDG